jgi:hypothetical protein
MKHNKHQIHTLNPNLEARLLRCHKNDSYIKKDEDTMDSALGLLKAKFHALALEHLNLKSLVELSISQEKARGKKKVEITMVLN